MQLSNIKKIELESFAVAILLHLLAILFYGMAIGKPTPPPQFGKIVKINLADIVDGADLATSNEAMASNALMEKQVMAEMAKAADAEKKMAEMLKNKEDEYLQTLQNTVLQMSVIPPEAAEGNMKGTAILHIEFNRAGKILSYKLKKSTGNEILDKAAKETGEKLMQNPFPPVPKDIYVGEKTLQYDFGINY